MIEYRKATIEDIRELVRTRIEFIKEVQKLGPECDTSSLEQSLHNYFNSTLVDQSFIAWLALDDHRIVGTSGLCFYTRPPSFKNPLGKGAYIMNVYTVSSYRKQGIASCLFQKVVEEAKALGYKKISLHATESGRPLYTKFGFLSTSGEMELNLV